MKDFNDKVAVVTGGAGGIGRALVERFTDEGMHAVIADIDAKLVEQATAELRDGGTLVLMSTHDLATAVETCDYLLCLNSRLIAFGPARTVFTPDVVRATYGKSVAFVGGGVVIHDAAR